MTRRHLLPLLAVAGVATVGVAAPAGAATSVYGTVGPGFTIKLDKKATGTSKVTTLKPGKYTFVIRDKSKMHNFHLTGPGSVNKKTAVGTVATVKWTVTLKKGTYKFVCDPHAAGMKGSFKVA